MNHIGIIPARAGSKRFPGKNRALLGGVELWRIAVDKSLRVMDRTIVNTDDDLIVPDDIYPPSPFRGGTCERYERPEHLRDGQSYRIDDVLIEMAQTLKFDDDDVIHLFQCTNPLLRIETVMAFYSILKGEYPQPHDHYDDTDSVQSICKVPNTLHAYSQRIIEGSMHHRSLVKFAYPEERNAHFNSQSKPDHWYFAGYIACRVGSLLKHGNIWGEKSIGFSVNNVEAMDIDTEVDLAIVELIVAAQFSVLWRPGPAAAKSRPDEAIQLPD